MPKISQAEYEKRAIEASDLPEDRQREVHLNARIDYLLGTEFPLDRRAALLARDQKLSKGFAGFLVASFFGADLPINATNISASMARRLFKRYSDILTPEEMTSYFKDSIPEGYSFEAKTKKFKP